MSDSTYILDDGLLAANGKRLLNYFLDLIFIFAIFYILMFVLGIVSTLLGIDITIFAQWLQNVNDLEAYLIGAVLMLIYYIPTEGFFGKSFAKFITGTIVVDENGNKPSFDMIVKRTFCRFLPFEAFSFISGGRGWHDSISDTYVVERKGLEQSKKMFYELNQIGVQEVEIN
ncbi:RDD family protein [Flavobacterium sp. W22_SRS_FK3]|uniref:RDD family protein n=1 Tax=Flavobacterium sp. W22_SRS_FK3 TaxID=3240275 RepID=UPI003F91A533